jgi:TPR repeat protein
MFESIKFTPTTILSRLYIAGFLAALVACAAPERANEVNVKANQGMVKRQDYEIVDCLLPGQVRSLGNTTYLTSRRPIRTNAADCHIRGGEYVAYDRADYKSALRVWMESANTGDIDAMTNVGEIYERGLGGEPNYAAAIIWYQKVIDSKGTDQTKSRALFDLGTLYEQGQGVDKDPLKALNLYRRAWGVPDDNLIYTSAKNREVGELRDQLEKAIAEKDEQIELMNKQIQELRKKSSSDTATMQHLVDRLVAERTENKQKLDTLPKTVALTTPTRAPSGTESTVNSPGGGAGLVVDKMDFGRYYALIIGNQNYDLLESLKTPRYDAERAAKILGGKYGFSVQVIEDGNDVAILKALNDLNTVLGPNDNLLIYYAGHGYRLQSDKMETGYWLPRNAERPPNDTFWVPNEQITSHIGRLQAKRVLVVADSCYAGLLSTDPSFFFLDKPTEVSKDYISFKLPKRSRLLIASGGDNPVLDEGGQGNSVFAKAFLDVLDTNNGILTAPALFSLVQVKVKEGAQRNHFPQQPEFKSIKGAGHEVGDFFFVPLAGAKAASASARDGRRPLARIVPEPKAQPGDRTGF